MLPYALGDTLTRPPCFQSSNPDEVPDFVGKMLAPHRMDMRTPTQMSAKMSRYDIGPALLVDLQYGTDVQIDPGELDSSFLVHAALQGATKIWSGNSEFVLVPDNLHVTSPGTPMRCHLTQECRHLTMRIPRTAFEDYLTRVMNIAANRPLIFYPGTEGGHELPMTWRNMLNHIISQTQLAPAIMANSRTQKQYALVLIEMLLSNYTNSYSDQIALHGNDISPWHVRRARDIIHASLEDMISVTDLAVQVGVSVRSLQNGFRQFLGLTPVEYVRRHRLERLHSALMDNDADASVTELMLECGIVNFGRYASYYRQQYGCRPSETLRSRRLS